MVIIKCEDEQKAAIKSALLNSDYCIVENSACEDSSCSQCLEKNIKWVTDETNSGFERLSGNFNRGYTKAIQDIIKVYGCVNEEVKCKKLKWNIGLILKVLDCFLVNREKFRDDKGSSIGFIRFIKDEKGKWSNVEYYEPK